MIRSPREIQLEESACQGAEPPPRRRWGQPTGRAALLPRTAESNPPGRMEIAFPRTFRQTHLRRGIFQEGVTQRYVLRRCWLGRPPSQVQHLDTRPVPEYRVPYPVRGTQLVASLGEHVPVDRSVPRSVPSDQPEHRGTRSKMIHKQVRLGELGGERVCDRVELPRCELIHRQPLAKEAARSQGSTDGRKMFAAVETSRPGRPGQKQIARDDIKLASRRSDVRPPVADYDRGPLAAADAVVEIREVRIGRSGNQRRDFNSGDVVHRGEAQTRPAVMPVARPMQATSLGYS